MPTPPSPEPGTTIAEQLRSLAAELDRQGHPEFVEAMLARGRAEGLKALQDTADGFLRRVDAARDTLRAVKHEAAAPYRAPVLKILKAVESAADVKRARQAGGPAKDDGDWMLAQRLALLPEHYRSLSADYGKTLNDLAAELATAMTEGPVPKSPARAGGRARPARREGTAKNRSKS